MNKHMPDKDTMRIRAAQAKKSASGASPDVGAQKPAFTCPICKQPLPRGICIPCGVIL